jgi:hypothetical protein
MGHKPLVIVGLLAAAVIIGLVIWTVVFLPGRLVDPIEFEPLPVTKISLQTALEKVDVFNEEGDTLVLTPLDVASLIESRLEKDLGLDISAVSVTFVDEVVVAVTTVRIGDIPATGYLAWLLSRRNTETTSTLIAARPHVSAGGIGLEVREFRIGRLRIPDVFVRRLGGGVPDILEDITVTGVEVREDALRISRRTAP